MSETGVTQALARFVVDSKWEDVPSAVRHEGSRAILEKQTGAKVEFLAYPFGLKNPEVIAKVQQAGYRAARGFPGGVWQGKRNLYTLKGLQIGDNLKAFSRAIERPAPKRSVRP